MRTCDLRAGVVADRILNGSILPLGQVSCVQAAMSVAELFSGQWH